MIALIKYVHACFWKSYRYGAPTFVFFMGIIFFYILSPNPVMGSYSFSAAFLFVIAIVISYIVFDVETMSQEAITLVHAGSVVKLYLAKLLYSLSFTTLLSLYAIVYPIIFQKFERTPLWDEVLLGMLYHILLSWLAISLACWFNAKLIRSRVMSFLLLSLVTVLTFSTPAIAQSLPEQLQLLSFLLPPYERIMNILLNYETAATVAKLTPIIRCVIYSLILNTAFLLLFSRRKLERA